MKTTMRARKSSGVLCCISLVLAALVLIDAFLFDIPFIYNDPPNFWGLGGFLLVAVSSGIQWRRGGRTS